MVLTSSLNSTPSLLSDGVSYRSEASTLPTSLGEASCKSQTKLQYCDVPNATSEEDMLAHLMRSDMGGEHEHCSLFPIIQPKSKNRSVSITAAEALLPRPTHVFPTSEPQMTFSIHTLFDVDARPHVTHMDPSVAERHARDFQPEVIKEPISQNENIPPTPAKGKDRWGTLKRKVSSFFRCQCLASETTRPTADPSSTSNRHPRVITKSRTTHTKSNSSSSFFFRLRRSAKAPTPQVLDDRLMQSLARQKRQQRLRRSQSYSGFSQDALNFLVTIDAPLRALEKQQDVVGENSGMVVQVAAQTIVTEGKPKVDTRDDTRKKVASRVLNDARRNLAITTPIYLDVPEDVVEGNSSQPEGKQLRRTRAFPADWRPLRRSRSFSGYSTVAKSVHDLEEDGMDIDGDIEDAMDLVSAVWRRSFLGDPLSFDDEAFTG